MFIGYCYILVNFKILVLHLFNTITKIGFFLLSQAMFTTQDIKHFNIKGQRVSHARLRAFITLLIFVTEITVEL